MSKFLKEKQTNRMKSSLLVAALFFVFEGAADILIDPDFIKIRKLETQIEELEKALAFLSPEELIKRIEQRDWMSPEQNEASVKKIKTLVGLREKELSENLQRSETEKEEVLHVKNTLSDRLQRLEVEKEQALHVKNTLSDRLLRLEAEKEQALEERNALFENLRRAEEEKEQNRTQFSHDMESLNSRLEGVQGELRQKEQDLTNLNNHLNPPSLFNACLSPLPLASWFNLILLDPFFNSTAQWTVNPEDSSRRQAFFAINPYVFWAPCSVSERHIKLLTTGLTLNGGVPIAKEWLISCGVGYSYSSIDWSSSDAAMRNIYFGPSVAYSSEMGYVRVRALGSYSRYHMFGKCAKQVSKSLDGWNFDAQVSGGLNFSLPAQFYLNPQLDLNYTLVSLHHDHSSATLKSSDFFRSKVALQAIRKCFFSNFLLTPQVALGWAWMKPLSQTYKAAATKDEKINYPASQQLYIDGGLSAAFQNGFVVLLDVESYICRTYPIEKVVLKVEWNW